MHSRETVIITIRTDWIKTTFNDENIVFLNDLHNPITILEYQMTFILKLLMSIYLFNLKPGLSKIMSGW